MSEDGVRTATKIDSVVRARKLYFSYGELPVIESIDMEVERGQVFGLVGPNGGGKTTLLKLIAGLLKPDSGSIEFNFKDHAAHSGRVGYMPQYASVNWRFPIKVIDVILMGLYGELGLLKRAGRREREQALEAAAMMGVERLVGRHISELSGGQQQRVFIARALAARPELLLLDEPASNMDADSQDMLYEHLERLRDDLGLTIMLVTHDLAIIPKICNQVACVNRRVIVHDRPDNLTCPVTEGYLGEQKEFFLHGDVPHRVVRRPEDGHEH